MRLRMLKFGGDIGADRMARLKAWPYVAAGICACCRVTTVLDTRVCCM